MQNRRRTDWAGSQLSDFNSPCVEHQREVCKRSYSRFCLKCRSGCKKYFDGDFQRQCPYVLSVSHIYNLYMYCRNGRMCRFMGSSQGFPKEDKQQIPDYKFIGIAFSTYIILELGKELYILDQHAAHERILYEKVKKNYYSDDQKDSQLMLLPDIINLSHKEMDIAKENMEMFEKAGFTLEEFGENTIKLSGVPNICLDLDTKELFLETLDEINTVARTAKQEKEEKFIATVACKAAVKANMALTKEEVDHLMSQLLVLPNPFTCPHGRPTAIKMTKTDIEKKFSRR